MSSTESLSGGPLPPERITMAKATIYVDHMSQPCRAIMIFARRVRVFCVTHPTQSLTSSAHLHLSLRAACAG